MSSFSLVLVEEGVEVEIPGDLTSVVSLLDEEVPWFSHAGHEYQLTPGRTELGVRWDLSIKLINSVHRDRDRPTVGADDLDDLWFRAALGEVVGEGFAPPVRTKISWSEVKIARPLNRVMHLFPYGLN